MSTKNLARTLVEGGRGKSMRDEERAFTRSERRLTNVWCRKLAVDDGWEGEVDDRGQPFDLTFADKFGALRRWVRSYAGKRWDDLYRDTSRWFDARTTKGWHIREHVIGAVDFYESKSYSYRYVHLDEDRVLRIGEHRRKNYRSYSNKQLDEVARWLGDWRLGYVGNRLFWFEPIDPIYVPNGIRYGVSRWRQGSPAAKKTEEWYLKYPIELREKLLPLFEKEQEEGFLKPKARRIPVRSREPKHLRSPTAQRGPKQQR